MFCFNELAFTVQVKHKINSIRILGFVLICLYFTTSHFHTCTLQRMSPIPLLILGSVFSDCVIFYGDILSCSYGPNLCRLIAELMQTSELYWRTKSSLLRLVMFHVHVQLRFSSRIFVLAKFKYWWSVNEWLTARVFNYRYFCVAVCTAIMLPFLTDSAQYSFVCVWNSVKWSEAYTVLAFHTCPFPFLFAKNC